MFHRHKPTDYLLPRYCIQQFVRDAALVTTEHPTESSLEKEEKGLLSVPRIIGNLFKSDEKKLIAAASAHLDSQGPVVRESECF